MLSTYSELQILPHTSSFLYSHLDKLADSCLVQNLERILLNDIKLNVIRHE